MDLADLFVQYRTFSHPEFLKGLRDLAFRDPKWLYSATDFDSEPLQGDIFPEVNLFYTSQDGAGVQYTGPAMLIANSCDAVPGQDPVAGMAPVINLERFAEELGTAAETLRTNKFTSRMFLPAAGDFPERYVDFRYIGSVSTNYIRTQFSTFGRERILRLSTNGWYLMTGKLAHHFARGER